MKDLRTLIVDVFYETLEENGGVLKEELHDGSILLDTGLSSLGFAIMVAKLEDSLNYDPFVLSEESNYPATFGDFLGAYRKFEHLRTENA